ncbi:outer membrane phospholipase A [Alcanivorax nanhaiticus]|uniref:Phospholipase A1 n=1 Tax=Alcanivorax nanhaiticus TaxID=1177154 RepID=A0A095UPS5_9GAMM|nr:phospholipase A [Alcanivorax nanhaiticus]KGD64525.1 outer membrane phospholipase A [Alcanivorax nanhaiticus]
MQRALVFGLFVLCSLTTAALAEPATEEEQADAAVPAEGTPPSAMTPKQRRDECLLRSVQSADNRVTVEEMRGWCDTGENGQKISAHEDALRARLALESNTSGNPFVITPHRRNYLMPYSYWSNRKWNDPDKDDSELQPTEVLFQLSLKAPIKEDLVDDVTLWMAFTGTFYWQAYNKEESALFRETNYEPEIFITKPVDWQFGAVDSELVALGFSHESNGRDVPVSRSWNRIFFNYVARTGSYYWSLKPWYRIPETEKDDPLDTQGDDNPDIEKYMGNFELEIARPFGNHVLEVMVRNNLRSDNKGAGRLNYSFPLSKRFKGLVQLFTGYGDSLINYDDYENRFSFGILLTDSL